VKQVLHDYLRSSIWRHRDLRLMLPARALSAFGDDMALLVLTLKVYELGRSPWAVTGLLLCSAVPVVVLSAPAGRIVDSAPFRTVAVAAAAWQAACCAGLALVGPLWATFALVTALQAGQVVSGPAWQALIPVVADPDEVGAAVGASQAANTLAAVAAPVAAGVMTGSLGYGAPLLADAGTFLVLGAAATAIRATRTSRPAADEKPVALRGRDHALRADPLLWPLILGVCAMVLVGEVTNVVEVFLLRGTLGASATAFGLVAGVLACAVVAGSIAAARAAPDETRARRLVVAALCLAIALAFAGLSPTLLVFAAAWAVVGVANGIVNADATTLLLGRTPDEFRGRVLARVNAMVRGSALGAMAIGGGAGTLLGPRATFVAAGALMGAVAAVLLARIRRLAAEPPGSPGPDLHRPRGDPGCGPSSDRAELSSR
jgi:MFS family permease